MTRFQMLEHEASMLAFPSAGTWLLCHWFSNHPRFDDMPIDRYHFSYIRCGKITRGQHTVACVSIHAQDDVIYHTAGECPFREGQEEARGG